MVMVTDGKMMNQVMKAICLRQGGHSQYEAGAASRGLMSKLDRLLLAPYACKVQKGACPPATMVTRDAAQPSPGNGRPCHEDVLANGKRRDETALILLILKLTMIIRL
jgi:hypothetical protein